MMPNSDAPNIEGVFLGFPFDQLLDRTCRMLPKDPTMSQRELLPGIRFATQNNPGTGNIVICGAPGSGKSTLALQFAVACTDPLKGSGNRYVSAYLSLESTIQEASAKAESFGWTEHLRPLPLPDDAGSAAFRQVDEFASSFDLGEALRVRLTNGNELEPCVILPLLSAHHFPRGGHTQVFQSRYRQVEKLLMAATELNKTPHGLGSKVGRILPVVVVDSLNMFGMEPLSREEICMLFSLFRRHRTTGVFVVETGQSTAFDSTMADVVIRLSATKDNGYFVRHLEIEKSRYFNQINGLHPFKTFALRFTETKERLMVPSIPAYDKDSSGPKLARTGIIVYPSLHYLVSKTDIEHKGASRTLGPFDFGIRQITQMLPRNLKRGQVVMIEGDRNTYKLTLAFNFLASGLACKENCLLVRLSDLSLAATESQPGAKWPLLDEGLGISDLKNSLKPVQDEHWQNLAEHSKAGINVWKFGNENSADGRLFELDFRGGAVLPEEFVNLVREILIRQEVPIRRVVLGDVAQIGMSYPFLRESLTTGDLFLPAFVHIMRNYGVDLVMTGTTGELRQSNEMVQRACSLSDAVINCKFRDVFGDRYVTVIGTGQMTPMVSETSMQGVGEIVPAVIRGAKDNRIRLDTSLLEGLVGFDNGKIYRPGLVVYTFEENVSVHGYYNRELLRMLQAGLASGPGIVPEKSNQIGQVEVHGFSPMDSTAMHESIAMLHDRGRPLDRTVVFTVDEFEEHLFDREEMAERWCRMEPEQDFLQTSDFLRFRDGTTEHSEPRYVWPYYTNFMLLAYRKEIEWPEKLTWGKLADLAGNVLIKRPQRFREVLAQIGRLTNMGRTPVLGSGTCDQGVPDIERVFWYDLSASETLSCLLLDALSSALALGKVPLPPRNERFLFLFDEDPQGEFIDKVNEELTALMKLFYKTGDRMSNSDDTVLPNNSAIYVCWYSQLRELIARCPSLGDHLNVCSLPGGGFRGDWFIGVARGSVSPTLGRRIIRALCSEEEDYKRFSLGVGLPTRTKFFGENGTKFYAWPRNRSIKLDALERIWSEAYERRHIPNYTKIRALIHTKARQLTPYTGPFNTVLDRVGFYQNLKEQIGVLVSQFSGPGVLSGLHESGPTSSEPQSPSPKYAA